MITYRTGQNYQALMMNPRRRKNMTKNVTIHEHELKMADQFAKSIPGFNKDVFIGTIANLRRDDEDNNRDNSELHRSNIHK